MYFLRLMTHLKYSKFFSVRSIKTPVFKNSTEILSTNRSPNHIYFVFFHIIQESWNFTWEFVIMTGLLWQIQLFKRDFFTGHQVLYLTVSNSSFSDDSAVDKLHEKNIAKELKLQMEDMKVFSSVGTTEISSLIGLLFLLVVSSVKQVCTESGREKLRILWRAHSTFAPSVIITITTACSQWGNWHLLCDHLTLMQKYRCFLFSSWNCYWPFKNLTYWRD